jgi:hypothetical protein
VVDLVPESPDPPLTPTDPPLSYVGVVRRGAFTPPHQSRRPAFTPPRRPANATGQVTQFADPPRCGVHWRWIRHIEIPQRRCASPARRRGHSTCYADVIPPRHTTSASVDDGWTPAGRRRGKAAWEHAPPTPTRRLTQLATQTSGFRVFKPAAFMATAFKSATFRCTSGLCDNPPRKISYYCLKPIHFGH